MRLNFQNFRLMILLAVLAMGCSHNTPSAIPEEWKASGEIRIYEVFGMDCPGCHGGLENQLTALDGVDGAKADWVQKQVTVWVSQGNLIGDEDIHEAIKRANFTPGDRIK
ncbi:MAG: heavy-metal-associated domain-containing protein [Candidatus Marinimicrobia bacterium]|nr:heavy-metal-associated domain-containing protein [Candidatus Neomarinimicrobiota bacterium]